MRLLQLLQWPHRLPDLPAKHLESPLLVQAPLRATPFEPISKLVLGSARTAEQARKSPHRVVRGMSAAVRPGVGTLRPASSLMADAAGAIYWKYVKWVKWRAAGS